MSDYNMGPYKPNEKGDYDPSKNYRYFDTVEFDGSWYLCIYKDDVDGTSCVGILPEGQAESPLYWRRIVSRGRDGLTPEVYKGFKTVDHTGVWDFNQTDKIIFPRSLLAPLTIENAYDGCCGIIITENQNIALPQNSDYSVDFNYIKIKDNQYYMYTFVCIPYGEGIKFLWNRTVMNHG